MKKIYLDLITCNDEQGLVSTFEERQEAFKDLSARLLGIESAVRELANFTDNGIEIPVKEAKRIVDGLKNGFREEK